MPDTETIEELRWKLSFCNEAYYKGEPIISDAEYDALFQEIKRLEENVQGPKQSEQVNKPMTTENTVWKHGIPMLSLHTEINSSFAGFVSFIRKVVEVIPTTLGEIEIEAQLKMDGLGLNLQYVDGYLKRVLTRNDGENGEDVTHCLELFRGSIPEKIQTNHPGLKEIRGEAMISNTEFKKLNVFLESSNLATRSNPRNAVAGLVRTKDPSRYPEVKLDFFSYGYGLTQTEYGESEEDFIRFAKSNGFEVHDWFREPYTFPLDYFSNPEKYVGWFGPYEFFKSTSEQRTQGKLDYLVDGVVYKLNRFSHQHLLGFRSREPRWAIAQKFPPTSRTTRLMAVTFGIGRTGKITPVGHIYPTDIDGVVVSKATLHNVFDIRRRNVRVGDDVVIYRSGDTIPEIGYLSKDKKRPRYLPNIRIPHNCPFCNLALSREKGEVNYYCTNDYCEEKVIMQLRYFVSRDVMDVGGLGDETIEKLVKRKIAKRPGEIYTLGANDLVQCDVPQANIDKILVSIQLSLTNDDWRFLLGLGIRLVGAVTAKSICRQYDLKEIPYLTHEQLLEVENVDDKTAKYIVDYFSNEGRRKEYEFFFWYLGSDFKSSKRTTNGKLKDKKIVFSGSFPSELRRDFLEEIVEREDGKVTKEVTKETDYFVIGENPTPRKLEKAQKFGVKTITPQEFLTIAKF